MYSSFILFSEVVGGEKGLKVETMTEQETQMVRKILGHVYVLVNWKKKTVYSCQNKYCFKLPESIWILNELEPFI